MYPRSGGSARHCAFWGGNSGSCPRGRDCPFVEDHIEGRLSNAHPLAFLRRNDVGLLQQQPNPVVSEGWRFQCVACDLCFPDDRALQDHYGSVQHTNRFTELCDLAGRVRQLQRWKSAVDGQESELGSSSYEERAGAEGRRPEARQADSVLAEGGRATTARRLVIPPSITSAASSETPASPPAANSPISKGKIIPRLPVAAEKLLIPKLPIAKGLILPQLPVESDKEGKFTATAEFPASGDPVSSFNKLSCSPTEVLDQARSDPPPFKQPVNEGSYRRNSLQQPSMSDDEQFKSVLSLTRDWIERGEPSALGAVSRTLGGWSDMPGHQPFPERLSSKAVAAGKPGQNRSPWKLEEVPGRGGSSWNMASQHTKSQARRRQKDNKRARKAAASGYAYDQAQSHGFSGARVQDSSWDGTTGTSPIEPIPLEDPEEPLEDFELADGSWLLRVCRRNSLASSVETLLMSHARNMNWVLSLDRRNIANLAALKERQALQVVDEFARASGNAGEAMSAFTTMIRATIHNGSPPAIEKENDLPGPPPRQQISALQPSEHPMKLERPWVRQQSAAQTLKPPDPVIDWEAELRTALRSRAEAASSDCQPPLLTQNRLNLLDDVEAKIGDNQSDAGEYHGAAHRFYPGSDRGSSLAEDELNLVWRAEASASKEEQPVSEEPSPEWVGKHTDSRSPSVISDKLQENEWEDFVAYQHQKMKLRRPVVMEGAIKQLNGRRIYSEEAKPKPPEQQQPEELLLDTSLPYDPEADAEFEQFLNTQVARICSYNRRQPSRSRSAPRSTRGTPQAHGSESTTRARK